MQKKLVKIKNNMKFNNGNGITLVALVITIIVLLILASVAINLTVGNNGIFTRAQNAVELYNNAAEEEKIAMNEFVNIFDNVASGNEKNQLLLDTADVEGNIILAAGIQNISKEMMDDIYKTRGNLTRVC